MSKSKVDFTVSGGGTVYILTPQTAAALAWVEEHISPDALRWGQNSVVVEHRYVADIVDGASADGLVVR